MKVQISVIVPVYNAEHTLRKCLDSVLSQDIGDFELVLVNDGSKDRSLDICRDYEMNDKRIVVIDKPNGGVSSARNAGLDVANGEWVLFVDSDDYLEEHFFDGVEGAAEDLLIRGIRFFNENESTIYVQQIDKLPSQPTLNKFVKTYVGTPLLRGPVAKFFRRSLIGNLRFPEDMKVGEDSYFVQRYLARCNNCKLLCGSLYNVFNHEVVERKYACSVAYAAKSLNHLMDSYGEMNAHLNIGWLSFRSFYVYFKFMSEGECKGHPWRWYAHPIISDICKRLWPVLPASQKWQYCLCSLLNRLKMF